ncbi:MAG: SRPBCC family protein [Thermoplasmata archaeon]|nr:MAG: SRPBCC family protein [Thermoplasmata archaeon]
MITLRDSIEIGVEPQIVFNWLMKLDENYNEWHPDHVKCVNETGQFKEGTVFYTEEYLHGDLHKIRFKAVKIEGNRRIEYKLLFPISIICPRGSFVIQPKNGNSVFTASLTFRGGRILSRLFRSRIEIQKKHMKEEGENLKNILEAQKNLK